MLDNSPGHPDPPVVVQVELVVVWLSLAPLVPSVGLEGNHSSILQDFGSLSNTIPGDDLSTKIVEIDNPRV